MTSHRPPTSRCFAVWLAFTTGCGLLEWLALPSLIEAVAMLARGDFALVPFARWLCWLAAAVGAASAGWLWVRGSLITREALRGLPGDPWKARGLRRLLLAACGLALVPISTGAAHADRQHAPRVPVPVAEAARLLEGLPLPERAESGPPAQRPARATRAPGRPLVVVAPGDTLWAIADRTLPPAASTQEVTHRWRAIYRANRAVIGADPNLIRPGQPLRLPHPTTPRSGR